MSVATAANPYVDAFGARPAGDKGPLWLEQRRTAALARFAELGYPTRRDEAWRFTNLRPLTQAPILPPATAGVAEAVVPKAALLTGPSHRLVLVNGRYSAGLSAIRDLPSGVWLGSTAAALAARPDLVARALSDATVAGAQPFASLGLAFFADGFILALEPDAILDAPVEIVHLGDAPTASAFHIRSAVIAGAGSSATVIESYVGSGKGWTNVTTALDIGERALLRHAKVQAESPEAIHLALTRATLGRAAHYSSFTLTTGARLSRHEIQADLAGEESRLALDGAYLLRDRQEATFASFVDHRAMGGTTSETVKGVMADRAHGVFLGTVTVHPGADRTDARQTNRNLLLSPNARVDTKPELAIFADDVKCSHGATVGDLDEASLFYLRARGIDEPMARRMLIEAFAADAIDGADVGDMVRAQLRRHLETWLDQPRRGA